MHRLVALNLLPVTLARRLLRNLSLPRLFLTLWSLLSAALAHGQIGYLQGAYFDPQSNSVATAAVTYASAQLVGDLNIVVIGTQGYDVVASFGYL